MAHGITQDQVNMAADALVTAGERPTVERIRAFLGTGSPNTVTRMLEVWWRLLGERLQIQKARLKLPSAPETVSALAGEWWTLALDAARGLADQQLKDEHDEIDTARLELSLEREQFQSTVTALQKSTEAAQQAERVANTQSMELQRLVAQMQEQIRDMTKQRDIALVQVAKAEQVRGELEKRLLHIENATRCEREAQAQYLRVTEDRALANVDRARQELKAARAQLATEQRDRVTKEKMVQKQLDELRGKLASAQQETVQERSRAETLERQISKLIEKSTTRHAKASRSPDASIPRSQVRIARKSA